MSRFAQPVPCAAKGCCLPVKPGMLMCKGHWFSVSPTVRARVWATWRTLQHWQGRVDRATQEKQIGAYRDAVHAACVSIEGVRSTPAAAMQTTGVDAHSWPVDFVQGRLL